MPAQARPRNPVLKHMFVGRMNDADVAWFSKIGGFASEIEVAEAHEGGRANFAWQSGGKRKFTPLEVTVVASENRELFDWHERCAAVGDLDGAEGDEVKTTFYIDVYVRGKKRLGRWVFHEAWCSKHTPMGELDAATTGFAEESATINYRNYEWEPA